MERNWLLLLLMIVVSILHAAPIKNKNVPRCGVEDSKKGKFTLVHGYRWRKQHITWAFHGPAPSHIGHEETIKIISEAFQRWADIVPLKFSNVCTTCNADVPVYFSSDDGPSKSLGYMEPKGPLPYFDGTHPIIVFDKDENWSTKVSGNRDGQFSLFVVAAHEIGHLLGLDHDESREALMYKKHREGHFNKKDIVPPRDKYEVQTIYGSKNSGRGRRTTTTTTTTSAPSYDDDDDVNDDDGFPKIPPMPTPVSPPDLKNGNNCVEKTVRYGNGYKTERRCSSSSSSSSNSHISYNNYK